MRKGILVCLIICLAMLATAGLSRADTYVLQIPSTQPWTNTNIWLEVGDWLEIWATGSIKWADPACMPPRTGWRALPAMNSLWLPILRCPKTP